MAYPRLKQVKPKLNTAISPKTSIGLALLSKKQPQFSYLCNRRVTVPPKRATAYRYGNTHRIITNWSVWCNERLRMSWEGSWFCRLKWLLSYDKILNTEKYP
jgi:hypothetical protein